MSSAVRVVMFNSDETYGPTLRSTLLEFEGLKILAEVDEPAIIGEAIKQLPCDVLIVNLDPYGENLLPMLAPVAEANSDLPIFAISESTDGQLILAAMRHGIREFITKPIDNAVLGEALSKVSGKAASRGKQGKLITVIGGAGGVGATTLAVNLATELKTLTSGDVALVDLDYRFGQVATHLDVEPTYTIADLCESPEQLEHQVIERTLVRHSSGVRVLSRPLHFAQADNITAAHCVGVLTALTAVNDYVVVDGPTRFDYGTKAVLDISDTNLLVLQLVVPTVRSVHRMLEGMKEVGFNLDRMKLICNRVDCVGSCVTVEDVSGTLSMEVFGEVPDDWATVNAAINIGEPLATAAPKAKVRLAMKAMAEQLHSPSSSTENAEGNRKKGGLFSKIF